LYQGEIWSVGNAAEDVPESALGRYAPSSAF